MTLAVVRRTLTLVTAAPTCAGTKLAAVTHAKAAMTLLPTEMNLTKINTVVVILNLDAVIPAKIRVTAAIPNQAAQMRLILVMAKLELVRINMVVAIQNVIVATIRRSLAATKLTLVMMIATANMTTMTMTMTTAMMTTTNKVELPLIHVVRCHSGANAHTDHDDDLKDQTLQGKSWLKHYLAFTNVGTLTEACECCVEVLIKQHNGTGMY